MEAEPSEVQPHGRLTLYRAFENRELSRFSEAELTTELLRRIETPLQADHRVGLDELLILGERVRDRLEDRLDIDKNRWSIRSAGLGTYFTRRCVEQHGVPIVGAVHVDLGCGSQNPFGPMFLHMMMGAREAICMDLDPPQDVTKAIRQIARLATAALVRPAELFPYIPVDRLRILQNVSDFDLARIARGDPDGVPSRLRYVQRSILETGLPPGSADVVFTNSVLEHLPDLDQLLAECARITRPGGFGVHGVDFRDHRSYGDSSMHKLEFLCESAEQRMIGGCNRLRRHEVEATFRRHGFDVVDASTWDDQKIDEAFRNRLVSPWREMSDEQLSCIWLNLLVRKRSH